MPLQPPPQVLAVLSNFDARLDAFRIGQLRDAISNTVADVESLSPKSRKGLWAERSAFWFMGGRENAGEPWGTYFRPQASDGINQCPDLRLADAEVIAYWTSRAKSSKHPILIARYADLVWDTTKFVTNGKAKIEFARLAIDNYLAASRLDDGTDWGNTRHSLGRALRLALSIKDQSRTSEAVTAHLEYVERTADIDNLNTYSYLIDNLLPPEKGPQLTAEQEQQVVEMFEATFAEMTTPGGEWDVDPHSPRDVGIRLADHYSRRGKPEHSTRIYRAAAEAFERRAKMGDAMSRLTFFQDAREFYLKAGLQAEADRVQVESQKAGPDAEKQMVPMRMEQTIPVEELYRFLDAMMAGGMRQALPRFGRNFLPDQSVIAKEIEEGAQDHPLYSMLFDRAVKLGHGHIEANVGDETGDPDGKMVHHTAQRIQFDGPEMRWVLERMVRDGLSPDQVVEFVRLCPLFTDDRELLIRQGIEAHFKGDYAQAIHLLIPQIERAIVNLPPLAGKPSNKAHRTGRGVMQFKSLNDVLAKDGWPFPGEGENLRMYLLCALAHPKGLNIRNDVCHGLWSAANFTRTASDRVLHILFVVSMLRPASEGEVGDTEAEPG